MPQHRKLKDPQAVEALRAWWKVYRSTPSAEEMARRHGVNVKTIRKLCEWRTYKKPLEDDHLLRKTSTQFIRGEKLG